jgi:hypothetical protein
MLLVWTLPWENMTLGQANQLIVISALIKSAVVRSARYLQALQEKRYIEDTKILEPEAFGLLLNAFQNAKKEGLAECVLVKVRVSDGETLQELSETVYKHLRQTDIMGISEGGLRILLSNTSPSDADFVVSRFEKLGIETEIVEDGIVCLRPDRVS